MGDFKKLIAWQSSMDLVEEVYRASAGLPAAERFGLQSQLRRAAVSVAANIAEGSGKGTDPEFIRFLRIARGSASEVECLVRVAVRLTYFIPEIGDAICARADSVSRLILALQRGLRS